MGFLFLDLFSENSDTPPDNWNEFQCRRMQTGIVL